MPLPFYARYDQVSKVSRIAPTLLSFIDPIPCLLVMALDALYLAQDPPANAFLLAQYARTPTRITHWNQF